jgi:hypothetical protein
MKCSVRILAGAVMLVTLAGCNTTQGPTATEPLGYAEATGSIDPIDPLPPIRPVKKRVFLLMGGLNGGDGWVTSAGMYALRSSLKALPDVELTTYNWKSYKDAYDAIALLPKHDIVIVIGYSGGGHKATWLANGYSGVPGRYWGRPRIDLMVVYDASPTWAMMPIHDNVKRAINFRSATPLFFGLGGGALVGNTEIETVDIYEHHLLVQINQTLHQRTIAEVKKVQKSVDSTAVQ